MTTQMQQEQAITPESVHRMVYAFYDKVRKDDVLGPVFEHVLHGKWETHLPRMVEFWSTVLLGTSSFQGNVYGKHMALAGIAPEHFARWLGLFEETLTEMHDEASASRIMEVAQRIAGSLQLGFFGQRFI